MDYIFLNLRVICIYKYIDSFFKFQIDSIFKLSL